MADLGVLDVLVIGGGMGGCIVATRLAEHGVHPETGKPLRIAILERGPTSREIEFQSWIRNPISPQSVHQCRPGLQGEHPLHHGQWVHPG